jgi:hypothetical protein
LRFPRPKITSAHVLSLIALFVALGGTVYAAGAVNGKLIRKGSIPGNRLRADGVTGAQVNEASLGAVPRAQSADQANEAARAKEANKAKQANEATIANEAKKATQANTAQKAVSATTAENAASLGGVGAGGYQRACANGAVKGAVVVNSAFATTSEPTEFPGFNCSGAPILVRKVSTGEYSVRFVNGPGGENPPAPASVSMATGSMATTARVRSIKEAVTDVPVFLVQILSNGAPQDDTIFTVVAF